MMASKMSNNLAALNKIVDEIIETKSLSLTQRLLRSLKTSLNDELDPQTCIDLWKQIATLCLSPSIKAEYIGYEFLMFLMQGTLQFAKSMKSSFLKKAQEHGELLLETYNKNPNILNGLSGAIDRIAVMRKLYKEDLNFNFLLTILRPSWFYILTSPLESRENKLIIIRQIEQLVWRSEDSALSHAIIQFHLQVLSIFPLSYDSSIGATMVSSSIDLFERLDPLPESYGCEYVEIILSRLLVMHENSHTNEQMESMEDLMLLLNIRRLVEMYPLVLATTHNLALCGALLYTYTLKELSAFQLELLEILKHSLMITLSKQKVNVNVDMLYLPLVACFSIYKEESTVLLNLVTQIQSRQSTYERAIPKNSDNVSKVQICKTSIHLRAFYALKFDKAMCLEWLENLKENNELASVTQNKSYELIYTLVVGSLLSDARLQIRTAMIQVLLATEVAAGRKTPWSIFAVKNLVSTLYFHLSQGHINSNLLQAQALSHSWITDGLYLIAKLAATSSETMKVIFRIVNSMSNLPSCRPMAMKLLYTVYKRDSRVYPKLEQYLLKQEEDSETSIVQMSIIMEISTNDSDRAVESFLPQIQVGLQHELVSIASMALHSITQLCLADCLDYFTAHKIIASKIRKNNVPTINHLLFQEELCGFYGACGTIMNAMDPQQQDVEFSDSKALGKVLKEIWGFVDISSDIISNSTEFALDALTKFPMRVSVVLETFVDRKEAIFQWLEYSTLSGQGRKSLEEILTQLMKHELQHIIPKSLDTVDNNSENYTHELTNISKSSTKEIKNAIGNIARNQDSIINDEYSTENIYGLIPILRNVTETQSSTTRRGKLLKVATQQLNEVDKKLTNWMKSYTWSRLTKSLGIDILDTKENRMKLESISTYLCWLSHFDAWEKMMSVYAERLYELVTLQSPANAEYNELMQRFVESIRNIIAMWQNIDENNDNLIRFFALGSFLSAVNNISKSYTAVHSIILEAHMAWKDLLIYANDQIHSLSQFSYDSNEYKILCACSAFQLSLNCRYSSSMGPSAIELLKTSHMAIVELIPKFENIPLLRAIIIQSGTAIAGTVVKVERINDENIALEDALSHVQLLLKWFFFSFGVDLVDFNIQNTESYPEHLSSGALQSSHDLGCTWAVAMALGEACSTLLPLVHSHSTLNKLTNYFLEQWKKSLHCIYLKNIMAIVLGPIILSAVEYRLISSNVINFFVEECYKHLNLSNSQSSFFGGLYMVLPLLLHQMTLVGCLFTSAKNYWQMFHSQLKKVDQNSKHAIFVIYGLQNSLGSTIGVIPSASWKPWDISYEQFQTPCIDLSHEVEFVPLALEFLQRQLQCKSNPLLSVTTASVISALRSQASIETGAKALAVLHISKIQLGRDIRTLAIEKRPFFVESQLRLLQFTDLQSYSGDLSLDVARSLATASILNGISNVPSLPAFSYSGVVYELMRYFQGEPQTKLIIDVQESCLRFLLTRCNRFSQFIPRFYSPNSWNRWSKHEQKLLLQNLDRINLTKETHNSFMQNLLTSELKAFADSNPNINSRLDSLNLVHPLWSNTASVEENISRAAFALGPTLLQDKVSITYTEHEIIQMLQNNIQHLNDNILLILAWVEILQTKKDEAQMLIFNALIRNLSGDLKSQDIWKLCTDMAPMNISDTNILRQRIVVLLEKITESPKLSAYFNIAIGMGIQPILLSYENFQCKNSNTSSANVTQIVSNLLPFALSNKDHEIISILSSNQELHQHFTYLFTKQFLLLSSLDNKNLLSTTLEKRLRQYWSLQSNLL